MNCKTLLAIVVLVVLGPALSACSTNPATGKQQFAALMSPAQEVQVGASEHKKVIQQFGLYDDPALQNYVSAVGKRVTAETERPDVQYKFFVLDSPIVNAFALPGGYIYVSRGLLALANNEAELAAVLAHETGHITGRHSAERYSHSVVTSLGAAVIAAVVDSHGVSQALDLGSNLYLSSYSRGQESEADTLGLRYMVRGGYDPTQMATFLSSLQAQSALDSHLSGKSGGTGFSYFSTHPATSERVAKTRAEALQYGQGGLVNRDAYLNAIDGLVYGDSAKQGFVRGQTFYHPAIGFRFDVPSGFTLSNQPHQVVATSKSGAVAVFDLVKSNGLRDPAAFIAQEWIKGEPAVEIERIAVNGLQGAAASLPGQVNGRPVTIQLVAIAWGESMVRFQMAIPQGAPGSVIEDLKRMTYSFRALGAGEKSTLKPYRLHVVKARPGDSIATLASRQPFSDLSQERFRVLNGLDAGEAVQAGRRYKLVVE